MVSPCSFNFFNSETSRIPAGILPKNPISLRLLSITVGSFSPGIKCWLSVPCLDPCCAVSIAILNRSEKPRPKCLASFAFRARSSVAVFLRNSASLPRPASRLLELLGQVPGLVLLFLF